MSVLPSTTIADVVFWTIGNYSATLGDSSDADYKVVHSGKRVIISNCHVRFLHAKL